MTPKDLLDEWLVGTKIELGGHYEAAKVFERRQMALGYPTVIFSAIASSAIVSALNDSTVLLFNAITIFISMTVTVLTSLQTFLQYSSRADRHKATAVELGRLLREVQQALAFEDAITKPQADAFRTRWDEISKSAPSIPDAIYNRHTVRVCKRAGQSEKTLTR